MLFRPCGNSRQLWRPLVCALWPAVQHQARRNQPMKPENFGNNLKRLRLSKDWSQSCFSIASRFSQSQISDFETGRRTPTLKNLFRLRAALGCSWEDLLGKPK